jgi:hypothetical protein
MSFAGRLRPPSGLAPVLDSETSLWVEAGGTKVSIRAPGAALAPTIPERMRAPKFAALRLEHPSTDRLPVHIPAS